MASPQIQSIIDQIVAAGKAHAAGEPGARGDLVDLGRSLVMGLEIPSEFVQRSFWAEPALAGICRIFVEKKAFELLREAGAAGLTAKDLAEKTGIEQRLLERFLRHLSAMRLITCSGGSWCGTPLSNELGTKAFEASIEFCYDVGGPAFFSWPEFFRKNGYRTPVSMTEGPIQHAHESQLPFFGFISATPRHLANFDVFMSAYRVGHAEWHDPGFYPVAERLVDGFDSEASSGVFLVDVGGGKGHDLSKFAARYPDHPGKAILQDREPVIASIEDAAAKPFAATVHDFFTPEPVQHARAYFMHSVLHDWDDQDGTRILENLRPALKPGYSRLLLNEIVLSEQNPTLAATNMDVQMLAYLGGNVHERTESEWRNMLAQAGYKVTKIYSFPGTAESVIEAEVA